MTDVVVTRYSYPDYCNSYNIVDIQSGYSESIGCSGCISRQLIESSDTGLYTCSFSNILGTGTTYDASQVICVLPVIRYDFDDSGISLSNYQGTNVYLDADNNQFVIKVFSYSDQSLVDLASTSQLYLENYLFVSQYPYGVAFGQQIYPQNYMQGNVRIPFYIDLTTKSTPVCSDKNITVTYVSDTLYEVQTRYWGNAVSIQGALAVESDELCASVLSYTLPTSTGDGNYFEISVNSITTDAEDPTNFVGIYCVLIVCCANLPN